MVNTSPATIRAFFCFITSSLLASYSSSSKVWSTSFCMAMISSLSVLLKILILMSSLSKPAENPILIAVSTLSPVSTQTLMPTYLNAVIVSATSSCNLSSIAVDPTKVSWVSISSYRASILASLSCISH